MEKTRMMKRPMVFQTFKTKTAATAVAVVAAVALP